MISVSNNNSQTFTGGITRKLSRNYYSTQQEIVDLFNNHPQKNGIAGQLSKSGIENLNNSKFSQNKNEIINNIYQQFASIIELASTNVKVASKKLTELLQNNGLLADYQSYRIREIDTNGSVIDNAFVLKGVNGVEDLFIKKFVDFSTSSPSLYKWWTQRDGKFIELARAMQLNHQLKDRHIMRTYWGDTKNGYMVSEYVKPFKNFDSFVQIKDCYNTENELILDLEKKYGFKYSELKKNNVQIGYKNNNKFYSYPEEIIIYNYFSKLLNKLNLVHHDLRNNPDNYIVTIDKNGTPLLKLIDFGGITR